jgi:hypothetical protein
VSIAATSRSIWSSPLSPPRKNSKTTVTSA